MTQTATMLPSRKFYCVCFFPLVGYPFLGKRRGLFTVVSQLQLRVDYCKSFHSPGYGPPGLGALTGRVGVLIAIFRSNNSTVVLLVQSRRPRERLLGLLLLLLLPIFLLRLLLQLLVLLLRLLLSFHEIRPCWRKSPTSRRKR